ncbi:zf-HC2 domain-containing protein [Mobilitalea sibirica]|uniref:Zf-HC2 domain-containing protein n=1 Tax=Mobilitalea sibirica TaxID=1462919 RepID=A0A8J7KZA1_9FIRM|nr:zf-HC2 domain-containing protein [Mobilitalea sibirica]MBH1939753.1 zf-HC2 domain-containing protein [Mobilitalea sibirica]
MTCMRAQSLITPFINDELNIKELEEFIEHVRSCKECREELEVYYALLTAMKQLDEDKNLSDDFSMELSAKLEKAQEKIIHIKFAYYRKKGILIFIIIMLAFFISFQYAFISQEKENPVTESTFKLRTEFQKRRYELIDIELKEKLEDQGWDY